VIMGIWWRLRRGRGALYMLPRPQCEDARGGPYASGGLGCQYRRARSLVSAREAARGTLRSLKKLREPQLQADNHA
jgi:hypothetical protein